MDGRRRSGNCLIIIGLLSTLSMPVASSAGLIVSLGTSRTPVTHRDLLAAAGVESSTEVPLAPGILLLKLSSEDGSTLAAEQVDLISDVGELGHALHLGMSRLSSIGLSRAYEFAIPKRPDERLLEAPELLSSQILFPNPRLSEMADGRFRNADAVWLSSRSQGTYRPSVSGMNAGNIFLADPVDFDGVEVAARDVNSENRENPATGNAIAKSSTYSTGKLMIILLAVIGVFCLREARGRSYA